MGKIGILWTGGGPVGGLLVSYAKPIHGVKIEWSRFAPTSGYAKRNDVKHREC